MYQGSCHCGQTRFTLAADALGPVAECNCSHCQRKGYLLSFHPRAALAVQAGEAELATYTFHRHVVAHSLCPRCGWSVIMLNRRWERLGCNPPIARLNSMCVQAARRGRSI